MLIWPYSFECKNNCKSLPLAVCLRVTYTSYNAQCFIYTYIYINIHGIAWSHNAVFSSLTQGGILPHQREGGGRYSPYQSTSIIPPSRRYWAGIGFKIGSISWGLITICNIWSATSLYTYILRDFSSFDIMLLHL